MGKCYNMEILALVLMLLIRNTQSQRDAKKLAHVLITSNLNLDTYY